MGWPTREARSYHSPRCERGPVVLARLLAALIHLAGSGRLAARAVVVLAPFRGAAEAFVVVPAR